MNKYKLKLKKSEIYGVLNKGEYTNIDEALNKVSNEFKLINTAKRSCFTTWIEFVGTEKQILLFADFYCFFKMTPMDKFLEKRMRIAKFKI